MRGTGKEKVKKCETVRKKERKKGSRRKKKRK